MTWYSPPNQAQRQYLLAHLDFGKTVSHMKDHTGSYLWDYNVTLFNFSVETVITTKFRSEDTHSLFWSIILCIVAVKFLWLNLHDFSLFWGFSGSSAGKESTCNAGDPGSIPGSGKIPWRRDRLPTPVFLSLPDGSDSKESACNEADLGLIPGVGRSPRAGHSNHSSILVWRIPWTEETGRLQFMGSQSQTQLSN